MPTLEWIGKDKVVNHHLEVPYRVLEEQYTYNAETSENMIIRGDNLEALKALLPRYEGRVKCIYIDPPYNTGNEGWVYNDNVNDPRIKKWLGEVVGKEGEDLSRHDKWLCMMYPRLKLLQRLLADDGAIFISIDDPKSVEPGSRIPLAAEFGFCRTGGRVHERNAPERPAVFPGYRPRDADSLCAELRFPADRQQEKGRAQGLPGERESSEICSVFQG